MNLKSLAFLACLVIYPSLLEACPSCFTSDGKNREAYFWTAIIMSALPLSIIGGLVWALRKHLREPRDLENLMMETSAPELEEKEEAEKLHSHS